MRNLFNSTVFAVLIGLFCLGSIVQASVGFKQNGTPVGAAGAINNNNGVNWSWDGFTLTINGLNWQNVTGIQISQINWTGANILNSGVNWESVRVANGNTSSSINWQAFGV